MKWLFWLTFTPFGNMAYRMHILQAATRKIFCLSVTSLPTLYYSLVYPCLVYCVSVWASTYPTNLNRTVIVQKKVARFISKKPFDAHTDPVFKEFQMCWSFPILIRFKSESLCTFIKLAFFLVYSMKCFQWLIRFTHIIPDILILPTYFLPDWMLNVLL